MYCGSPTRLFFFLSSLLFGTLWILPVMTTETMMSTTVPSPATTEATTVNGNATNKTELPVSVLTCVSEADHLFKFSLTTHRNSTGHWIAQIDVQPGTGPLLREENPFEVQLQHHTHTCAACEDQPPPYARLSISEPPPLRAPKVGGYRYFPGFGFYKRHLEQKGWHEARAVCQAEGADLVVINSEVEAKLLLEMSAPLLLMKPGSLWNAEAYVGIYDFHHEGHFTSVKGQLLEDTGYMAWSPGEPNNHKEEDCVTMVRNGMYNDVGCSKMFEFICEVED